ncbi:MAG TPA: hypothetical protein VFE12_18645, partial [Acetobacteraceae bacterium]|nr:hypothetical protein [Acetobacteraceae bacterium]
MTFARRGPRWIARLLACAALVLALCPAQAQMIGDVQVESEGADVVAHVSFNGRVRFLQQAPTTPAELYRVTFDLVAADELALNLATEESRRVPATAGAPEFTLTYRPVQGQRIKELVLRLREASSLKVRQGPSTRIIDFVFVGAATRAPAPRPDVAASAPVTGSLPAAPPRTAAVATPDIETRAAELMTA